jgi:hypothetical protein
MIRYVFIVLCIAAPLALADSSTSRVNGSIHVAPSEQHGDVSTVNGAIRIDADAEAADVRTVNGSITLGERAVARSVRTVNGSITLRSGARVSGGVRTVNGSISLGEEATAGSLSNVNGTIRLDRAHVRGDVETVSGDIDVGAGSRIDGGITIHEPSGGWFRWRERTPRVVVGPEAVVSGTLRFEREVELYVSDRARIGPVQGAEAIRFPGERPPEHQRVL